MYFLGKQIADFCLGNLRGILQAYLCGIAFSDKSMAIFQRTILRVFFGIIEDGKPLPSSKTVERKHSAPIPSFVFVFVFVFFCFLTALFSFFSFVHFFLFVFRFFLFIVGFPPEARKGEGRRVIKNIFGFRTIRRNC